MNEVLLLSIAYLLGSIPTAVWVSQRFFGIDIREHGSGNAGATNTFRILGKQAGIAVMLVDMMKGFVAVKLAYLSFYSANDTSDAFTNLQLALGLVAVLGHIFPLFAGFKGGKGIATLFGMILGIQWMVALCLVGVFLIMLVLTRYVSLSSITAGIAFPLLLIFIFKGQEPAYTLFAISTAALVILTHHKNINRLLKGSESKVKLKRPKSPRE
ncbi:MAG TPA: glycerol-3-phosphate 1-O-acyltransferase PlsY [Edaphocola sp.]|nr:glycerol-3-phosphate 1-O-acyltransferase PlsY [Edaphocola sp.]